MEEIQEQREELVRVRDMWLKEQQVHRKALEDERSRADHEILQQREELAKERRRFAAEMELQRQELVKERSQCQSDILVCVCVCVCVSVWLCFCFLWPRMCVGHMSLGDIHNLPTFWVSALFGTFYNFCFRVQTCRHLGGGYVCTF